MDTPYWLDEPYTPRPTLEESLTADVAILGGGITGAAAALFMAQKGCRVALVERGPIAFGASGRNAGLLLAGIARNYESSVRMIGPDRSRQLWALSTENHELIRSIIDQEKIDCHYARNGSTILALRDTERNSLVKSAALLNADGFSAEFLDDTEIARRFPGSGFQAGLFNPGDGEIHPARFVRGLTAAAERSGATIFENSPVTKIDRGVDTVTLTTEKGCLSASMLLLATNGTTGMLHPYFKAPLVPMRAQMFATEPCEQRIFPTPIYADFGFEYFRQLTDGRILAGGGRRASLNAELTTANGPTKPVQSAIEEFLHAHFPATRKLKITHRWGGTMGFSCDELPSVGPVPGSVNTYVAAGYHGHGMGFAVIAAEAVTGMMLEGSTPVPIDLLSPRRHLPE